jgi:S1-C subfamily serine protease
VAAIAAFLSGAVVTLIARGDTGHPAASSSTQTQSTNRSQAAPKSRRAWLGVEMESWPMGGAVVNRVAPSGPAASAGLMPGDLIVSFNGSPVGEASDVTGALARLHPGQVVSVQIRRGSAPMTVQVTLAARPGGSRAP